MISKKITAILKLGLALLPAATALGGLGTIIGMSVKESSENDMAVDLYAQTEDFIAEKEGKLQLAKQAFDNGEISEEEFENLTDHLNSKEFIQSALKSNVIRDEEVKTHIAKRDASSKGELYSLIPFSVGLMSLFSYATGFREFFCVRENMRENYQERQQKQKRKEEKMRKQEEKLYSEEIVQD